VKSPRLLFVASVALVAAALAYTAKDSLRTTVHVAPVPLSGDKLEGSRRVVETRDGGRRDLARPPGKILLLHFWATWCPPCVEEFPGLLAFYRENEKNPALELLTISVDEDWKTVDTWLNARGASAVPVTLDPRRQAAEAFGTKKFPETFVLSPKGEILLYVKGPFDWSSKEFRNRLDEIVRAASSTPPGPSDARRT
jgi:cytochrome c biogenesis protein CcmG/thiol:disulfide interchange protein DsbE